MSCVHEKDIEEDEINLDAEIEKPAMSQIGDLWILGDHRVLCGDSNIPENFDMLLEGKKANLVVTDPPYNVDYEGNAGRIKNDKMPEEIFEKFLFAAYVNMEQHLEDDGSIYVFHSEAFTANVNN